MHEYFGRYTFSIGGDGPTVSAWIDRNRSHLKKAGVVRVGVRSGEGWRIPEIVRALGVKETAPIESGYVNALEVARRQAYQ